MKENLILEKMNKQEDRVITDPLEYLSFLKEISINYLSKIEKNFGFIDLFKAYSYDEYNKKQIATFIDIIKNSLENLIYIYELKNRFDITFKNHNFEGYKKVLNSSKEELETYKKLIEKTKKLTQELLKKEIK